MSADDEWWAVEHDPIEDALSDCRNGHHGSSSVVLAEYVDQLRARVAALEKVIRELPMFTDGTSIAFINQTLDAIRSADLTASADHG